MSSLKTTLGILMTGLMLAGCQTAATYQAAPEANLKPADKAQLAKARRAYPDLTPWLEDTLAHEERHRARFREAMPSRAAKPCRLMSVWSFGGALLGAVTALTGRTGIYVCTAAVERTVHRHLVEQIAYLDRADPPLAAIVRDKILAHAA